MIMTLEKVQLLYGKKYDIVKRPGTEVELADLKDGESVCYGDGETYHWLLTERKDQDKV
jgi:hypothetical protein